jgi:hypothetical protein
MDQVPLSSVETKIINDAVITPSVQPTSKEESAGNAIYQLLCQSANQNIGRNLKLPGNLPLTFALVPINLATRGRVRFIS